MARNRILGSIFLASGVLLFAACATEPRGALLEKKFQRAAQNYQQYQHEGQTVYCRKNGTRSMPMHCVTEAQLRSEVESFEKRRNTIQPPVMPGAGKGGIG